MARRKRLGPASIGAETETDMAFGEATAAPEVKSALRPGVPASFAASPSVAPPIARVAAESAAEAALAEISDVLGRARAEGRLVLRLKLAEIDADHLVRDRIGLDEEELAGLIASIRDHGQRTPIEVSEIAPGRYGLISGWRRLTALRRLAAESGEDRFGHIHALVRKPETAAEAYVSMVEENEIRLGLSYYERARIAARAVEQGVFDSEREALRRLFANASRARRSKIGSFLGLYHHLDTVLRFPASIPERLGLALVKALEDADSAILETFLENLRADPAPDAAAEMATLSHFAEQSRVAVAPQGPEPQEVPPENVSRAKHSAPRASSLPPPDPGPEGGGAGAGREEIRPGVFLAISGGFTRPVLTLSGPGVDPVFRERLEDWLLNGG